MTWAGRISLSEFLAKLPSTNARIFCTLIAFELTVIVYLYLLSVGADSGIDESVFGMWLTFLSVWAGIDHVQFRTKRLTHMETPPAKPDIEDAKATTPAN